MLSVYRLIYSKNTQLVYKNNRPLWGSNPRPWGHKSKPSTIEASDRWHISGYYWNPGIRIALHVCVCVYQHAFIIRITLHECSYAYMQAYMHACMHAQ